VRSDGGDEGQRWAVLYDDGMSLTTASERIALGLAEAEHQRGRSVTVRRLDEAETEPVHAAEPEPPGRPEPPRRLEPARTPERPGPQAGEPDSVSGPARAATRTRRRRLLLYALAAACIVIAAALVDHWGVLPRVGASTSSGPTQISGPSYRPQLLPPLGQPPVMHFSHTGGGGH
jgi:hypothetical protein